MHRSETVAVELLLRGIYNYFIVQLQISKELAITCYFFSAEVAF